MIPAQELVKKIDLVFNQWTKNNPATTFYEQSDKPICPAEFQLIERFSVELGLREIPELKNLSMGPNAEIFGLFLYGQSYTGKTTSVYRFASLFLATRILRNLENEEENWPEEVPMIWESVSFGDTAKLKAKTTKLAEWLDELIYPEVLIFDDIDKFAFSDSVATALWDIIKRRIENKRFTIFTSNITANKLVNLFPVNMREPLLNRFRKWYLPVHFQKPKPENS